MKARTSNPIGQIVAGRYYRKARRARKRHREIQLAFLRCFFKGIPIPKFFRRHPKSL